MRLILLDRFSVGYIYLAGHETMHCHVGNLAFMYLVAYIKFRLSIIIGLDYWADLLWTKNHFDTLKQGLVTCRTAGMYILDCTDSLR